MNDATKLRVLLVGSGGREHALAWKLSLSKRVEHVYVAPGNGGTAQGLEKVSNLNRNSTDYEGILRKAKKMRVNLVVAGTERAIVDGLQGLFQDAGIRCFVANMPGSKAWAKDFMRRNGIPTAQYAHFTNYNMAKQHLESSKFPVVIKPSGLATGKSGVIAKDLAKAVATLNDFMLLGPVGTSVVIEEFLVGDELSILAFTDGKTAFHLVPAYGHKRIYDGDRGLMTEGMGVVAPVTFAVAEVQAAHKDFSENILRPTLNGLKKEGLTYVGMLFIGLILTPSSGFKVIGYSARFGDPESQSLLLLLREDTDLAEIMVACMDGHLKDVRIHDKNDFACNVVITAGGYPEKYKQGDEIQLGILPEGVMAFHGGTRLDDEGRLWTAGGRVFSITATGNTLAKAVAAAYEGVRAVKFDNMHYRRDIGGRWVGRLTT